MSELQESHQAPEHMPLPGSSGDEGVVRTPESDEMSDRFSTMHEVALEICSTRSREDILAILRRDSHWLIDHDLAYLALVEPSLEGYRIFSLSPLSDASELSQLQCAMDDGVTGSVLRSQAPLLLDLPVGPGFAELVPGVPDAVQYHLKLLGMHTLLLVPLNTGQETVGALGFASVERLAYVQRDMVIAQMLATHAAVTMKNLTLFDEAQRRITQIELVNELSDRLTETLELDRLLQSVVDAIRRTFKYFDVAFFTLDAAESEVVLTAHSGEKEDFLPPNYRQKLSEGIVGWVATHGEKVLVNDVSRDSRYVTYAHDETRSELALPVRIEREIVGVLNIEDRQPGAFDDTDAAVLGTLCDQLGVSIRNARLYDRLKKNNAKLLEVDRMKSDFLGIVSHDFRSPLSTIVLAANSLQKRWEALEKNKIQEYLGMIVDQATKLANLAEDVLSISRMEAGKLTYYFSSVNLERVVNDAASQVKFSSRHTLDYQFDRAALLVKADQAKLRQVVQNLISNAVKYSPQGGPVRVKVKSYSSEFLQVSVEDEGIGIPENQLEKLFQKFSRIDSDATKKISGSGLGLWICKEIVKAHGGEIWVERRQGRGSVFNFTIKKAPG
jgi:K+-sensing histidine kinase KdpD